MMNSMTTEPKPLQVTTFNSFQVNKLQSFDILLSHHVKPSDLHVSVTSPPLGSIEKQLDWSSSGYQQVNRSKCTVSFKVPSVGIYNVRVELLNQPQQQQQQHNSCVEFQAKAYDLSKVLIQNSSGQCRVNESYEFGVDASEAGEGQLEIAVNEGEIPNQVQVLDNGKCIVNFVPEEAVPHVVDIKFNGHNVIGCPFVVQVDPVHGAPSGSAITEADTRKTPIITEEPKLITNDRILVNSRASFTLENVHWDQIDKSEVIVVDPESRPIEYLVTRDPVKLGNFRFEFTPATVGDYSVKLASHSQLNNQLPYSFPFSLKVFDFNKVLVSDVTNGVIGHPVYFFIDASQAGSGNLEIRVSSETRNVPNYPQQEANAKIRVNFTPTEAVDHTIDVKFNGISVPNNPFIVKVAQMPQARLPVRSQDLLKYVAVDETVEFTVEYLESNSSRTAASELTSKSCSVTVLRPDFTCVSLDDIQLIRSQQADKSNKQAVALFKIRFKATKIGPYKLFITVDNELLPASPTLSNVYNIHEVKVLFEERESPDAKPVGRINEPVTFTVDASRAGEGTLALAVVSSRSSNPVPTSVDVSDKGHGLYNLSFIPTEFAVHSIDMSFNDRVVPSSPFIVDILNSNGESALALSQQQQQQRVDAVDLNGSRSARELTNDMSGLSLQHNSGVKTKSKAPVAPPPAALSKEDEMYQSLVVHGVSLKRTPVNSTGAFIIETNQMADPKDFDVLIAGPSNSLVDVRCYRDQADNLTVEWEPVRVGTHKIEVLYRDRPVPGSPFMSEAFDPSGVILEPLAASQYMLGDLVELRINRKQAGQADLEVLLTNPEGEEQRVEVKLDDGVEVASFRPSSVPGRYRVSITYGGYEVPRSPVTLSVRDNREPVKVTGPGLRCAEVNRSAQFSVESSSDGELKLRIECGDREIVPKVERKGRSYAIKYKPTDIGYAIISLYWDGSHIDGSPFSVPVNDLTKFAFVNSQPNNSGAGSSSSSSSSQITLDYEPRLAREITLDTSACGPGELKAEAYCRANPSIKFSIPVNQVKTGRHKLIFTCPPGPEQLASGINLNDFPVEATYLIRFYYNNLVVPETLASVSLSPTSSRAAVNSKSSLTRENGINRAAAAAAAVEPNNNNHNDPPRPAGEVVQLRGHGLAEAKCGQVGEFTIDGRLVGHGSPQVKLFSPSSSEEVKVHLEPLEAHLYKATYVALADGAHTLNVLWDGKQVAGCPLTVNISPNCDSSKVICTADSLKGGVLGEEIKTFIDTRKAGPGELTALCTGPAKVAFCELLDRGDGTFVLYIKPQESGRHSLTINYGGAHIPKSPFSFKVSGKPDPSRVRVYGPGVEHGVLPHYQSRFMCDTRGAGAGQLTVRIRGPKGAFRMETERANQKDRTILCKYDPTEPGDYRIEIKWSGRHVPGSPFSVMIFDTQEELNRFLLSRQQQQPQQQVGSHHSAATGSKKHSNNGAAPQPHQVAPPFQPTLVEYGHGYASNVAPAGATHQHRHQQPPFRLQ